VSKRNAGRAAQTAATEPRKAVSREILHRARPAGLAGNGTMPATMHAPSTSLQRPAGPRAWVASLLAVGLVGCASRAVDIAPERTSPAEFLSWSCERIVDEQDRVQLRAADVAYAVDERAGHNIVALGVGFTLFWPALLAARPAGVEAQELARLKGRFEALGVAARGKQCPALGPDLPAARAAALPVALGERLLYEDRIEARRPPSAWSLEVTALRRGELVYRAQGAAFSGDWRADPSGNVLAAPTGSLQWPRLLRPDLELGAITAGDMVMVGDPQLRARLRGQVVAAGVQTVGGRRFDALVVELFGDAQRGDASTRVEGALVVDRASGVLLRLDLRSADPAFTLQRRLVGIAPPPP